MDAKDKRVGPIRLRALCWLTVRRSAGSYLPWRVLYPVERCKFGKS